MSAPGTKARSRASPETGLVSITSDTGSGDVTKPSRSASMVAHGRPRSSRAATTRNGIAVWNARCSSGRKGRTTLRA